MSSFLRTYGTTLGPVGIPMADELAFALDTIFKQLSAEYPLHIETDFKTMASRP